MKNIIDDYLIQAKVGRRQSYGNLTIFPLLSAYALNLDYILLNEAISENLIEVMEVDEEGVVAELKVINKSPKMVLILDGEELVGSKQDRVVNTSILIPGNCNIEIPVSSVEEGRWSYNSPRFSIHDRMMPPGLRAMKAEQVHLSVRKFRRFRSNQIVIWEEIFDKAKRMGAHSTRMAMANIYEKEMSSIQKYIKQFRLIEGQIGAVFMINGKVAGLDSFGNPETFSRVFKRLAGSYALDAIDWFDQKGIYKTVKEDVTNFLRACQTARVEIYQSVGNGMDYRLDSKEVTGFGLVLDGQVLHMSIFPKVHGPVPGNRGSGT